MVACPVPISVPNKDYYRFLVTSYLGKYGEYWDERRRRENQNETGLDGLPKSGTYPRMPTLGTRLLVHSGIVMEMLQQFDIRGMKHDDTGPFFELEK